MYFYSHRINSIDKLKNLQKDVGVEIDIREYKSNLVLSHDPFFKNLIYLNDFLPLLNGRNIIANIKSERIENKFVNMKNKLAPNSNYFFLDSSFSMIANFGNIFNFASRFSEYESIETSFKLFENSFIKWIWIDTFKSFPVNAENVNLINSLKIKKCFTSPDLLNRTEDIKVYAFLIKKYGLKLDAICCKERNIKLWKKYLL